MKRLYDAKPDLPLSAGAPAAARPQLSIDISYPQALSSKPAGSRCCCRPMDGTDRQTDRQTDGRMDVRPLHRSCSAYCVGSVNEQAKLHCTKQKTRYCLDSSETICPRRWQFDSRRIYVRPRTGPQSTHLWWPAVAKLQAASVPIA